MDKTILVTRPSMPDFDEYISELKDIWDSCWLTNMGPKHKEFQKQLSLRLGTENIELVVNGHMALETAIQSMNFRKDGQIITTPFTFVSTTHAIVRNGLEPVFCDINPEDYTMDVDKIEELITDRTVAILPVHVYGNVCNIDAIDKLAKKYNLKVIYDAAHAFGETYRGKDISTYGDAACFSFHATKVFNSIEGGAITFADEKLRSVIYGLKNFGIRGEEDIDGVGTNAKLNEFCAAMGICNLRKLDADIAKRKVLVERYRQLLGGIDGIKLNSVSEELVSNYAYFPVVFDKEIFGADRDEVKAALAKENIIARKYFYPIINDCECYSDKYNSEDTPVAKKISQNVLTLPLYSDLEIEYVEKICRIILGLRK